MIDYVNTV